MSSNEVSFDDVMSNIREALDCSLDGEEIAELHNRVYNKKIRYIEDSVWEYTGEQD